MGKKKIEIVHQGRGGHLIYDGYEYAIELVEAGHFCIHFPSGHRHGKLQEHLIALEDFAERQDPKWFVEGRGRALIDEGCEGNDRDTA